MPNSEISTEEYPVSLGAEELNNIFDSAEDRPVYRWEAARAARAELSSIGPMEMYYYKGFRAASRPSRNRH